jgi:hypothetical protein
LRRWPELDFSERRLSGSSPEMPLAPASEGCRGRANAANASELYLRAYGPSTRWSTKLRGLGGTYPTLGGLTKPQLRPHADLSRYRTQEVAGSSPASSIT